MAGFLYLIVAITAFFTFFVTEKLFVAGDAITTTNNIMTSGSLFSLSIISSLIMVICWVLVVFALYVLFKLVNKNYAFLMVSLVLIGGAITCINTLNQFAALLILNGADYLIAFETNQLQALTMLFLDLFKYKILINQIFFSL